MNHDHGQAKNDPSSAGLLLKHVYCILSLNDNMMTFVWFSVLKALKSNFVIFASVDKLLLPCLITFSSLQYYNIICLLLHIYQEL